MRKIDLQSKRGRFALIFILGTLGMFPAMATDVYMPAFPQVARDLHVSINQVQFTLVAGMLGMAVGMPIWGSISDRVGRKLPALIGTAAYVLMSVLCIFAPNLWTLLLWRLIQGFGSAAAVVCGRAIVRDLFTGTEMARMLAAVSSVFFITPVVAPSIGALILGFANWQALFVFMALFGVVGIWGLLQLPESLKPQNRVANGFVVSVRGYGKILRDGYFRQFMLQNMASVAVTMSYISATADVYLVHYRVPTSAFGFIFGLTALGQMAGAQLNRRLLKRFAVKSLLTAFVLGQITFATILFMVGHLTDNLGLVIAFQVLTVFCGGSVVGNGTTLAMRDYAVNAAAAVALLALGQAASASLVTTLTAFIPLQPVQRMTTAMWIAALISVSLMASRAIAERRAVAAAAS